MTVPSVIDEETSERLKEFKELYDEKETVDMLKRATDKAKARSELNDEVRRTWRAADLHLSGPQVSVVVTVKNAELALPNLLDSLLNLTPPPGGFEVVIVDGFSTDTTWTILEHFKKSAPFTVHIAQKAGGISAGRNAAIRISTGQFIAVTDADLVVRPWWLVELLRGFEDGEVGVVGGPNIGDERFWWQRCTNAIPTHGPSTREVPLMWNRRFLEDYISGGDIWTAVTRNCMIRRWAIESVGGFDESLPTTEDGELNHRLVQKGWKIQYRRAPLAIHTHRQSLGAFCRQIAGYGKGQAMVNRIHPELRLKRHMAPGAALALFLLAVGLSAWLRGPTALVAAGMASLAILVAVVYSLKAAIQNRDATLLLGVPVLFLAWQASWVVGYAKGAMRR